MDPWPLLIIAVCLPIAGLAVAIFMSTFRCIRRICVAIRNLYCRILRKPVKRQRIEPRL
jgi:hypothetical protein